MEGHLSVCATPIGNLEDITLRVLNTLREADLIAAEDTRHTKKLLNHFEIETPLISYHQHNEKERAPQLIQMMLEGKHIALVSDAGTPAISDPGQVLVHECHKAGVRVTSLPGPCAFVTALSLSGMPSRRFIFEGFLPTAKKEQIELLENLKEETRTVMFYEAPHRLGKTLELMAQVLGERRLATVRELTKHYEEIREDLLSGHIAYYSEHEPKGEFVLILEGVSEDVLEEKKQQQWSEMTLEEHMALYKHLSEKDAMKQVAKDRGVSKRDIYAQLKA